MGSHPINLMVRFGLELAALLATGAWGWRQDDGWMRYLLAFGIPFILALIWGIFNVPGDPSRSGNAPIITPGIARLFIELGFFTIAVWALNDMDYSRLALALAVITLFHYLVSYDRIIWLLSK